MPFRAIENPLRSECLIIFRVQNDITIYDVSILQFVLLHYHKRLVHFFLWAIHCQYFLIDEHNKKETIYYVPLTKVFGSVGYNFLKLI